MIKFSKEKVLLLHMKMQKTIGKSIISRHRRRCLSK